MEPEARGRHEHARARDADAKVAAQCQVGRAAVHTPVHDCDRRQRKGLDRVEQVLEAAIEPIEDRLDSEA